MSSLAYGGGTRGRGRVGPGSTMSCDSDIRFTRRHLSQGCRCGCALLAAFFVFLLVAAVCVYVGCEYNQYTYALALLNKSIPGGASTVK